MRHIRRRILDAGEALEISALPLVAFALAAQRVLVVGAVSPLPEGTRRALINRTFGAHYVRACIDQARFARGLGEPPEPVVTGHHAADSLVVEPHDLETYDALFETPENSRAETPASPEADAAEPGGVAAPDGPDEFEDG